ncbi:MAG TPA: sugar ABC transporter substrate-binding protein [Chloroflexota bacterium]|nr:sugar ABC transporter substrate-binding protein [Chloroflexota bacterium]
MIRLEEMTRRRWLRAATTGIGAAVLAACGATGATGGSGSAGGTQTKAQGKVQFMSQAATPVDEERYRPIVEGFNARNTGVTVELIQNAEGGGAVQAQSKVIALTAAGTPPDLFWTHAYVAPSLAKMGVTTDINPYIKRDRDFKLNSLFEAPVKDYDIDGKQTGLPREATTMIVIVNKELFQKNGVPLPKGEWTWDDFLKAAQQMSKGSGTQQTWGAGGAAGGQGFSLYNIYPKVWQEGGDIVDKTRTKFMLHLSPAVEQVQWLADLVNRHRVHPGPNDFPGNAIQESWNSGRIGMFVQISVYSNFNKAQFDWDIVPLPKGKTKATRTASAGHSMTVGSKNKDAAWEFLKVLASKPTYEHWAKTGLSIPTHKEVAQATVGNPTVPPKSAAISLEAFSYARSEPISGDWGNFGAEVGKALAPVWTGQTDAKSALTPIVQTVESLLTKTPG